MSKSPRIVEMEFTTLHLYEDYILSQPKEGVIIKELQIAELVKICSDHYQENKVVYISHRINNFNVDPLVYLKLQNISNLMGMAVVTQKPSSLNMAAFESNFVKFPFKIFLNIQEAEEWIKLVLQKEKNGK